MSTIVTTQQELDAAIAAGAEQIIIESPRGVWLSVRDSATVEAWGSANVRASGSATVWASGSTTVRASGSATVWASGSTTVEASGSATVRASGSATVRAWDSATVRAWGSANVRAGSHVAVHLHGVATISGGVLIDHTAVDLTDPATWCAYFGVAVDDGIATVYKAVDDAWTTGRGADYSPGATPEAPDWRADGKCGGGLHFSPTPRQARAYYPDATRYVAVGIRLDEMSPIADYGTPKVKARRVVVACREVDIDGKPVES